MPRWQLTASGCSPVADGYLSSVGGARCPGLARREAVYLERTYVLAHIDGRLRVRGMSLPEVAWG